MERRIAAILAADMVGFSRLVELDEAGTLERQKQHRIELIDPTIERHNGNGIKLTGDGLLAEFGSAVEAVQGWAGEPIGDYPSARVANVCALRSSHKDQRFVEKYIDALVAAGIPEE